jgi:RecA-family ATPase
MYSASGVVHAVDFYNGPYYLERRVKKFTMNNRRVKHMHTISILLYI